MTVVLEYSGSIIAPIIMHFLWNGIGALVLGGVSLADDYPNLFVNDFYWKRYFVRGICKIEGSIIVLIVNVILIAFFYIYTKEKYKHRFRFIEPRSQLNTAGTKPLLHGNIYHATAVFLIFLLSAGYFKSDKFESLAEILFAILEMWYIQKYLKLPIDPHGTSWVRVDISRTGGRQL